MKALLIDRYASIRRHLEYFVGSRDDAADVLQEMWLRLETMRDVLPMSGEAYLMRIANNVAIDHFRREKRHKHDDDAGETHDLPDELADPERIVAARRRVERLGRVMLDLSPRQREIMMAACIGGDLNRDIAARLGISLRLVEKELSVALKYCNDSMPGIASPRTGQSMGRRKY
jgi:RNA polymerase sigma factor (sigma-70 family)